MTDIGHDAPVGDWVIARDGDDVPPELKYLSDEQAWAPLDDAMRFASEDEAINGAETLCPAFMPGHAEAASAHDRGPATVDPDAPGGSLFRDGDAVEPNEPG